ncbi:hypothetical protein [Flindersiella endophytica]
MTTAKTKIDGGTRWQWYIEPDPEQEYLAVATVIQLGSIWDLPRFQWHAQAIHRQLSHTAGLVGFSFEAKFPTRYWTLSAWANGKALQGFIRNGSHRTAMPVMGRTMRDFAHVHWKVPGSGLPLLWADGLRRLDLQIANRRSTGPVEGS